MEIFAKLGIDWRLLIFQIVNFSILLFVLHRFLYKPFLGILETRRRKIEESMAQVDAIARKDKETEERTVREIKRAQEETKRMMDKAIEDVEKVKEDLMKKASGESARLIERAKKEIDAEREKIMTEIRREAADIVVDAAEKILKEEIHKERHERLVKEALS